MCLSTRFIIPARPIAIALLLLVAGTSYGLLIDTGHQGAITALALDSRRDMLASASSDGTVKIWDVREGVLVRSILVSHLPVRDIVLHPSQPLVATLDVSPPDSSRIAVWNWVQGQLVYEIELEDVPLHIGFSTLGSYLYYTRTDWQSIVIHDAVSGDRLPYMENGFGIVSFAAFSRSERNLMTYQPSGSVAYWEVKTGEKLKELRAPADLTSHQITEDFKTLFARSSDGVVVLDLATGELLASDKQTGIQDVEISPDGSRVVCVSETGDSCQWIYRSGRLTRIETSSQGSTAAAVGMRIMYEGNEHGTIISRPFHGTDERLSQNNLAPIKDVAARDDRIALLVEGKLMVFDLEYPGFAGSSSRSISDYEVNSYSVRGVGAAFLSDTELVLWDDGGDVRVRSLPYGSQIASPGSFTSPVTAATGLGNRILALESNGTIRVVEPDWQTVFSYTSPGTHAVCAMSDDVLIGARTRMSPYEHPLIRINSRTGETVPLEDSAFASYALAPDPGRKRFFSLSMDAGPHGNRTSVKMHQGRGYEKNTDVLSWDDEDTAASLIVDPQSGTLFTSIGYQVRSWESGQTAVFESSDHIPRKLVLANRLVLSLNHDGTVSAWDTRTGKLLLDFFLFADGSWLARLPQDRAYLSHDADRYVIR